MQCYTERVVTSLYRTGSKQHIVLLLPGNAKASFVFFINHKKTLPLKILKDAVADDALI
jgi:hypothetical protein